MSGALRDGVRLSGIVGDLSVHEGDDVGADGGLHYIRKRYGVGGGTSIGSHVILQGLHGDEGAGGGSCHFFGGGGERGGCEKMKALGF